MAPGIHGSWQPHTHTHVTQPVSRVTDAAHTATYQQQILRRMYQNANRILRGIVEVTKARGVSELRMADGNTDGRTRTVPVMM